MLAEEFLRRRLDPEHAGAKIDAVEIEGENLVLAVARLQIDRQNRFLDFAVIGAAGGEEQVLGQLLRQGRAALHHMAGRHVAHAGPYQPHRIDAEMFAETPVLDGDEGVGDVSRKGGDFYHGALHQAAAGDQASAIVQNGDVARGPCDQKIAHIGQAREEMRKDHRAENDAPGQQHDDGIGPTAFTACGAAGDRLAADRGRSARAQ